MGGSFDPVHTGHLIVAENAREEFCLEKVLFIPAGIPPHKKVFFAGAGERLEMLRMATGDNPFFEVSNIETGRMGPSYTYDTVIHIEKEYPGSGIYLIVGEDAFSEISTWHEYKLLIQRVVFLIAPRKIGRPLILPGEDIRYHYIGSPLVEISSTYLRNCFSSGKTVKYMIPDTVEEYIRRNGIYGFERA